MGSDYGVRGIYIIFAIGAALVLFARGFAYWVEWRPWTVRIAGLVALFFGIVGAFGMGAATGLKALFGAVICADLYIWQDWNTEKDDLRKQQQQAEEFMEKLGHGPKEGEEPK